MSDPVHGHNISVKEVINGAKEDHLGKSQTLCDLGS